MRTPATADPAEPRAPLVHDNGGFFDSDDARPLRILAEYAEAAVGSTA